nr:hypothetical protein [Tanacetum cinerariifolium]
MKLMKMRKESHCQPTNKVESELAISKESVSETIRWISYGPRATVVKYDAYNINGYTFRMKCHYGKVYQNSGVSVEAIDVHISKEVPTTRQAFYYGVLQEIWVLGYRFRQIPLFKCDWVNHKVGGVKRNTTLGYTLVDLNNLGHKYDASAYLALGLHVLLFKNIWRFGVATCSDDIIGVSSKGPSITSIPKEGPSSSRLSKEPITKELLAWYGYDIVEDYLPVVEKPIPKFIFKSPNLIKRYVTTWDKIEKKMGLADVNDVVKLLALIDGKRVVITEDVIRQALRLDDADGVECLPNEEILTELARMGYEKPPPKLTFYKAFFSAQWKFLIHILVQCISAKRTAWNEFSCSMASAVICLATGRKFKFSMYIFDSIYTSLTLIEKVFANMRRVGKGFSGVETSLFATMLIQPPATEEDDEVEEQPTDTSMTLLHTLMATYATLSQKVTHLKQDKVAQALEIIKIKQRMDKMLHDEEVKLAVTREKQEQDDLKRAQELQQWYDQKHENIGWNVVVEQMQEKHLDNIRKYQSLKRKPIYVAQDKKNMIVYLKNMVGYKIAHFKGMTYDQVRPIFKREYNKVQTFLKPNRDEEPTKKRVAEETLLQESFKKVRAEVEVSVSEFKVEALQVKYPLIDWEIHPEGSRSYWKIIRVGEIAQAYLSFEDMLKDFKREDLDALWRLVKEKFSTPMLTEDKEKALWVELKRLHGTFMFLEKDYPLIDAVMILMMSTKLQFDEDCEMTRDLVMKIFMEANKPKSKKSLDTSSK